MEKYSERFQDIAVAQLDTSGFDKLTDKQKQLSYYLSEAGLWGRFIALDQGSEYNTPLFNALISLYKKAPPHEKLHQELKDSLFILFAHSGIYHSMSGERLKLSLQPETLDAHRAVFPQLVTDIENIWFKSHIKEFQTVQTEGVDGVRESGVNFYKNLTTSEVKEFRHTNYPKTEGEQIPPYGFNERLVKHHNGIISRETISSTGLYAVYVNKIIENLERALIYTENNEQHQSISTLIDFYKSADAADFDKHCVAWTKDRDSHIYFINGLIESYDDPLGVGCTFESVVAFKNPEQTLKVNKIIDNIQWFEDNLPFDKKFKKEKAVGLSASSINVISMAGRTSPSLPLGINLPNSDWIRKIHGSKSVNLANVAHTPQEAALREALYLPQYHALLERYANLTNSLHTDLHEIAGHGSGRVLEGVHTDQLGVYYSTIEEARADLVALYYIPEQKLQDFGVYDTHVNVQEAATAQYVSYLTNGAFAQLRRVALGQNLTQAHLRNRQLISQWILNNSSRDKVSLTKKGDSHFIEVRDVAYVRGKFGELLSIIQDIKSTANAEWAKDLVVTYGTQVNQELHKEILRRVEELDMPKIIAFLTPRLVQKDTGIVIEQPHDFFEQQLQIHEKYSESAALERKSQFKIK